MTQGEVIKLLKKSKRGMTKKQMAKKLNISTGSVASNCNKLFKQGEIKIVKYIKCFNVETPVYKIWEKK